MSTSKGLVLGGFLFFTGCGEVSPITPHSVIQPDMDPVRSAFNADIEKARVVMLVAPT